MNIKGAVAVVTGAGGGIGRALAMELAKRQIGGLALVDHSEAVKGVMKGVNQLVGAPLAHGYVGDVTDSAFRTRVFADLHQRHGCVNICVPASGFTRVALALKWATQKTTIRI